ncbi:type II toxin-antitoxin system HipA family toxin [Neptuniibacter sp. QD37_11]|uniref:type II toxin-antitoxin system HipA family toxin n=1 Tax=Neptuniibacter sp. QD37_11 TaxID=3398209 RepID=UPI0039F4B2EB
MTELYLPNRVRHVKVYSGADYAGRLTKEARHSFVYHDPDAPVISLTMATNKSESYNYGDLHPIFRQNLPEGYIRRYITERLSRHSKDIYLDDIYLLALQQENGIGQLSYESKIVLPEVEAVSLSDILGWQGKELLFPQLLEKYYLRGMLSGVQPKVAIEVGDRTLPQKEYIVKAFDEEFPQLTVNEFVCMKAADHCGLNPPAVYLSDNQETFVIERFDVGEEPMGFEDFTTLMKRKDDPNAKYEGSYEALLRAVSIFTGSAEELKRAYQYIAFNCLIGNGDAHLKNFALQYSQDLSNIRMSPIYDVTHTCIYGGANTELALKIAKSRQFPDKAALVKLANQTGLEISNPHELLDDLADGIVESVRGSEEAKLFKGLTESIEKSVMQGMGVDYNPKGYRHQKRKKFKQLEEDAKDLGIS